MLVGSTRNRRKYGFTKQAFLLDESTRRCHFSGRFTKRLCFFLYISVPCDSTNNKDVLEICDVRLTSHKGENPCDSDDYDDIGLSSEEEAEGLDASEYIRRKYDKPAPPPPPPVPPLPGLPGQSGLGSTTTEATPTTTTTTVSVPRSALQEVHSLLGRLLGQPGQSSSDVPIGVPHPAPATADNPFNVTRAKQGEKVCKVCKRTFWSTETLRKHQKTHTGTQKWTCTRPECGRKLASKRSFEKHKTTCGVEKRFFCRRKGCDSRFATKEGLAAHQSTHKKLSKKEGVCKFCNKDDFHRAKSLKDHIRFCEKNPNRVGPFPCPFEGCHRGPDDPFNHTRNLNQHLKNAHGYDPKHKF